MRKFACSVLVSFALAACGDDVAPDDGSGGGATSSSTATTVATGSSTSIASTSASSGGDGGDTGVGGEGGSGEGASGQGGEGAAGQGGSGASGQGGAGDGGAGASGQGGSSEGGAGQGGSTGNAIDCAVCVATECPAIAECISDPVCADGMVCTLTTCITDGQPDLVCIAECFDGDFGAAIGALEALGCIVTTCGDDCSGVVPGG